MFLQSKTFRIWLVLALAAWLVLFTTFNQLEFLAKHWFYPAIMVLGAFVAGVTPEGGGVVAFPVLNIFIGVDRVLARDFSLMIQSIGMTSASIFILSRRGTDLRAFRPLLWMLPVSFTGFVVGMLTLQRMPVPVIQALFLSLIATFAVAYYLSQHRGGRDRAAFTGSGDYLVAIPVLLLGGTCASLFGTGADIILYTLLVTRFALREKVATYMSIILMAGISVAGFAYRHFVDAGLSQYQVRTWLCAYPVVLFMAPLGAYVLQRLDKEWMLRAICVLNIGQVAYFLLGNPSWEKAFWTGGSIATLSLVFYVVMRRLAALHRAQRRDQAEEETPVSTGGGL